MSETTHDHECPQERRTDIADHRPCRCDLIARVRADERKAARERVLAKVLVAVPDDQHVVEWAQGRFADAAGGGTDG